MVHWRLGWQRALQDAQEFSRQQIKVGYLGMAGEEMHGRAFIQV